LKMEFPSEGKVAVSLVCELRDHLGLGSLEAFHRKAKRLLRDAGVCFAFGGVDLSYNQDGRSPDAWALQLWLIVPSDNREAWEPRLRALYPSTDRIKRPIKIQPFDGNLAGIAYALKTEFQRRVNFTQKKWANGVKRICSNTSDQPLRVAERLELYPFLESVELSARVFLLGARPTRTEQGISIVKLGRKSRNSDSAGDPELRSQGPMKDGQT
jgi:hypothetical protein